MKKILVVDDAMFMRLLIKNVINKSDEFEVIGEAYSGKDAIKKYKILKPDIVTMDITMPEMDGMEALKQLKIFDKNVNVVMISASGDGRIVRDAIMNGAKSFIIKPFIDDHFITALKNI